MGSSKVSRGVPEKTTPQATGVESVLNAIDGRWHPTRYKDDRIRYQMSIGGVALLPNA